MEEWDINSSSTSPKNVCKNMKPEYIARLKEQQHKCHAACLQKIEQWEKFKKDYEVLKDRLETLPEKISHDVMVPFGSHAFMPGQLIHTNEIMALLSANWFAEVSAKHAAEMSQRRISQCEKMLEDLKKEKEQYENWLKYINEDAGKDFVDLTEFMPDEEVEKDREKHKKNVAAYTLKIKQMIEAYQRGETCNDATKEIVETVDKDYFQILEKLGEREILYGEMDDELPEEDEDVKNNEEQVVNDTDQSSECEDEDDDEISDEDSSDEHSKSNGKHVKWKDQEKEKMKNCITFTHSSCKSRTKPMNISKAKSKSKESGPLSPVKIQSPSDIYKCFSTKPEQSKPKSILKRTSSIEDSDAVTEPVSDFARVKNNENVQIVETRFKEQTAFTGEIIEHEIDKDSSSEKTENTAQRPPSKFKANRQHRKS